MSVLFTFPGQGAQKPGMLHTLPDHAEAARTLDEASDALGREVLELDTESALRSTVEVQLCLLVAGVAMARVLAAHDARSKMVAGLSIGAWPAAVVAGVLEFDDAVRMVELRARLMEEAYPSGYGMTAITGLTARQLEPLIAQAHGPACPVYLANLNAERQLVISGADAAMAEVARLALDAGALRAERLAVPVPSHSALLADAARQLAAAAEGLAPRRPAITYISSSAARAMFDGRHILTDLVSNMASPVRWAESVRHAWERGARLAVEMPSGSVLSKLTAPVFEDGRTMCCDGNRLDSIVSAIQWQDKG